MCVKGVGRARSVFANEQDRADGERRAQAMAHRDNHHEAWRLDPQLRGDTQRAWSPFTSLPFPLHFPSPPIISLLISCQFFREENYFLPIDEQCRFINPASTTSQSQMHFHVIYRDV